VRKCSDEDPSSSFPPVASHRCSLGIFLCMQHPSTTGDSFEGSSATLRSLYRLDTSRLTAESLSQSDAFVDADQAETRHEKTRNMQGTCLGREFKIFLCSTV
jgi:hypothetical protein